VQESLVAPLQVVDPTHILVDQVARHKDAAVAKAIDQELEKPGVIRALGLDQLGKGHILVVVAAQRGSQQIRKEVYDQQAAHDE